MSHAYLSPTIAADDILWWSSGQWQAVGTVVLVLVTLTYVIYTARLSEHAKRSATSAEKAASAAEHSASSAERAAETAERGLLLQVMPLVFGHEARVTGGGRSDVTLFGVGRFPTFTLQVIVRQNDHEGVAGPIAYHDPLPRSKIVGIFKQRSRRRAR